MSYSKISIGLIALLTFSACLSEPKGKLNKNAQTEECSNELINALHAFSNDLGIPMNISKKDADAFFKTGKVQKEYGVAGVRYTAYFGLENAEGKCLMKFYKRSSSRPGQSTSERGNFGTVELKICTCE